MILLLMASSSLEMVYLDPGGSNKGVFACDADTSAKQIFACDLDRSDKGVFACGTRPNGRHTVRLLIVGVVVGRVFK